MRPRGAWPWVSRAHHVEVVHALTADVVRERATVAQLGLRLTAADARYDALMDRYHALRVSGANSAEAARPLERRTPDVVTQAILSKARGQPALFTHYAAFVAGQRALGLDEDAIAGAIMVGHDDDGGVPVA